MNDPRTASVMVEHSLPSERLDVFLRAQFPQVTRSTIQRLIEEGEIRVDGGVIKATHHPRAGEVITVHWPDVRPSEVLPQAIPLDILHEDEALLVVNKPPGLVVHPAAGNETNTLVNALLHHCAGKLSGIGGVARPGIVHRLDKDTSGCLVVAKTDAAHVALAEQFAGRTVQKTYHALVCGHVANASGEIRAAIARHASHRKVMTVSEERGRDAWTSYRVLRRLRHATLVEARIHTGRTHQIRVHFQFLGHPLVGDDAYGKRQVIRLEEQTKFAATRQMLHASQLAFTHPTSGSKVEFASPWPVDFNEAIAALEPS